VRALPFALDGERITEMTAVTAVPDGTERAGGGQGGIGGGRQGVCDAGGKLRLILRKCQVFLLSASAMMWEG